MVFWEADLAGTDSWEVGLLDLCSVSFLPMVRNNWLALCSSKSCIVMGNFGAASVACACGCDSADSEHENSMNTETFESACGHV